MKLTEFAREVTLPATTPSVLFSLILFFIFFQIAFLGRLFGIVIALVLAAQLVVFVLPALLRTLMQILEARSKGKEPAPPVVEFLSWVGHAWALFPLVHVTAFGYAFYLAGGLAGGAVAYGVAIVYALILPASLVVLAVTHSVLESLRFAAIIGLIRRCGFSYLTGPLFLMAATGIVIWLHGRFDSRLLTEFAIFYLTFASFAVFGGVVRSLQLEHELEIPDPANFNEEIFAECQEALRVSTLNHAYGLVSRGNRARGLEHLYNSLDDDPDSANSWAWYFGRMMDWENTAAALFFGQQYLHHLLHDRDNVAAVKIMLRCRLINEDFRPLADDTPLAIEAAEQCDNDELANLMRN